MFTNFENGIIPAAADVIKNDLKLNDGKLGILGSSVYLGI
jgi:hypothetical protein